MLKSLIERVACVAVFFVCLQATAEDLISVYGQQPAVRDVTISPDGKHFAFIRRGDGEDYFYVMNIEAQEIIGGANASELKARQVYFAGNNTVILVVSETRSSFNIRGKWEQDVAVAFQIDTGEMKTLLRQHKNLYPAQSGLSRIVGVNLVTNEVYMPVFIGRDNPRVNLLRVNLKTGRGRQHAKGRTTTRDWFVADDGTVLAREDFDAVAEEFSIWSYRTGKARKIYEEQTDIPSRSFGGVSSDRNHLVFIDTNKKGDAVYQMSLADGSIGEPMFQQTDRDIDSLLVAGLNREFIGVRVSGELRKNLYLEESLGQLVSAHQQRFGISSVIPVSATQNYEQLVLLVSGNHGADDYYIHDTAANTIAKVGKSYPTIQEEHIGRIAAVRYKARDGQPVTSILTWPVGFEKREGPAKLPTIVFPHGGPESYDRINFDWWAQYFARQGYLIFQPNFRGSSGYGHDFRNAGRGEWGGLMQDDITDGVHALVEIGHADPERVCIMGASYGGYAALAGGAFTPDLYRCVISVAGVADLPRMLSDERRYGSKQSWAITYWEKLIGDSKEDRDLVKAISPSRAAENFAAPVLLVHGRDDTVVLLNQSKRMRSALRKAGKQVELVTLKSADHWLSRSETRMATLSAIDEFLKVHNPVN